MLLTVPVHDVFLMAILYRYDDLAQRCLGLLLGIVVFGNDAIEELSAGHEVHDQVDVVLAVEDFLHADYIGMVGELQDLDLHLQRLLVF